MKLKNKTRRLRGQIPLRKLNLKTPIIHLLSLKSKLQNNITRSTIGRILPKRIKLKILILSRRKKIFQMVFTKSNHQFSTKMTIRIKWKIMKGTSPCLISIRKAMSWGFKSHRSMATQVLDKLLKRLNLYKDRKTSWWKTLIKKIKPLTMVL